MLPRSLPARSIIDSLERVISSWEFSRIFVFSRDIVMIACDRDDY